MRTTAKLIREPHTEEQHQKNVIAWSEIHRDKYPELCLLYHIPNGGRRDPIEMTHLKSIGLKPGIPDLCLPVARGKYSSLYIEMKTQKGRVSEEQKWIIERLNAEGCKAKVCHGWEEAVKTLEWYLEGATGNG